MTVNPVDDSFVGELPEPPFLISWNINIVMGDPYRIVFLYFFAEMILDE